MARRRISTRSASPGDGLLEAWQINIDRILIEIGTDLHSEYLTWTDKSVVELGAPHLMPSHIDSPNCTTAEGQAFTFFHPNRFAVIVGVLHESTWKWLDTLVNQKSKCYCLLHQYEYKHCCMNTFWNCVCVCVFRLRQHVYHLLKRRIPCKAWTQREWKAVHGCMTLFRILSWKKLPKLWW